MESKKYSNLTGEQMKIVHQYCDNNMQKLKQTCYPIIIKIGEISQKDYDDLYSLAQVVFLDSLLNYNEKICQFHPFLVSSLKKRLYSTHIRDRNRKKRSVVMKDDEGNDVFVKNISLENPTKKVQNYLSGLKSDFDVHKQCFGKASEKLDEYLEHLSDKQKKVAVLLLRGYTYSEIERILKIDRKELLDSIEGLKAYRNISILFT